jgi:HSP20 family protein
MLQLFRNRLATPTPFGNTLEPWNDLHREIDMLFDSVMQGRQPVGHNGEPRWTPAMDLVEHAEEFKLFVELPGVNPNDVTITVGNGLLTISGEKKTERESVRTDYDGVRVYECQYGRFERSLTLPQYVNADSVSAQYDNGVLALTLPKAAAARRKTIEIATGDNNQRQLEAGDRNLKSA